MNSSVDDCVRSILRGIGSLVAAALLVASPACEAEPAGVIDTGSPERLVFVSFRDGLTNEHGTAASEIYRIDADGTAAVNLTRAPAAYHGHLHASPDGRLLLFESDRDSCFNVWIMAPDGGDRTQLTGLDPADRCNEAPRWSPDGSQIAFTTSRGPIEPVDVGWEAFVMDADGGDPHTVSNLETNDWIHGWTPDGRVTFHALMPGGGVVTYRVDPDGTGLEPFFDVDGDREPYWSPDGSRIAFVSERDGNGEIYVMDANGTGATNLTGHPGADDFYPLLRHRDPWSPDGTRIAFSSDRTGDRDVFVMRSDGTGLVNVTASAGTDVFNGWSSDGMRIAFSSRRTGDWEVYLVNADATGLVNLTRHPADDMDAIWLPDGSAIGSQPPSPQP
jgi:Tol biopolymer transport system component